jgi:hypothetical protein
MGLISSLAQAVYWFHILNVNLHANGGLSTRTVQWIPTAFMCHSNFDINILRWYGEETGSCFRFLYKITMQTTSPVQILHVNAIQMDYHQSGHMYCKYLTYTGVNMSVSHKAIIIISPFNYVCKYSSLRSSRETSRMRTNLTLCL